MKLARMIDFIKKKLPHHCKEKDRGNGDTLRHPTVSGQNLFETLLLSLYTDRPATIIQIGACDGAINDPIYDAVKNKIKVKTIVLIEPQPDLIPILTKNYAFHRDARVINNAIGESGSLILFRLKKDYWTIFRRNYLKDAPEYRVPSGFVSQSYDHVVKHVRGNLPEGINLNEAIEELKIPSKELAEVLQSEGITRFDVLQVDVEGFDDEVIYRSSIKKYRPSIIHFEHMHLHETNKMKLYEFLKECGYLINEYSDSDTLATRGLSTPHQ